MHRESATVYDRIDSVRKALKIFLHCLPAGSKFNIIICDSELKCMFEKSADLNDQNIKTASD